VWQGAQRESKKPEKVEVDHGKEEILKKEFIEGI
jgi:hypothetical protein